jgi:hypothetical protein
MLPVVQKFLGRVFAHREQECPSAKGSVSREVKKALKTGIHESQIPLPGALLPCSVVASWMSSCCPSLLVQGSITCFRQF